VDVLNFGLTLTWVAAVTTALVWVLSVLAISTKDRRLVVSARSGFYVTFFLLLGASATLVYGFIAGVYNNEYIFGHSDRNLPFFFRFAGLWAGLEGSLLFWTFLVGAACAIAGFQHRWSSRHPSGRRMEPYVYLVLASVLGFFLALTLKQNPFGEMPAKNVAHLAGQFNLPMDHQGNLLNGKGLNPQLVNYWFVFHPPTLYLGMVTFTVPFAFGIGALISGEFGDYWIRITRRWAMVAWLFLTTGIILGGLWAYRQLGWGGYWAWDPVENASFLPWCAATAFLHSIMIQERRDMLKWWNVFLLIFAFFLTIEATYMTRAGEVDSVHAFAGGTDIGTWFRIFKWTIAGTGLFLLFYRFSDLRGQHQLESLLSREAAFFINNLVLVAIAVATWTLSWFPNLSESYTGNKITYDVNDFNLFMTPLLLLLLILTAIGPGLGWVKTTKKALKKNFIGPTLFSLVALAVTYTLFAVLRPETMTGKQVFVPKPIADWIWEKDSPTVFYPAGLYPTGIGLFCAYLILGTIGAEWWRGLRARMKFRGEGFVTALLNLFTRDNRRWGGYIVHIGISTLVIGIFISAMFRTEEEKLIVKMGEHARIGDYVISPKKANRPYAEIQRAEMDIRMKKKRVEDFEEGLPYLRDQVFFEIHYDPLPEDENGKIAHAAAGDEKVPLGVSEQFKRDVRQQGMRFVSSKGLSENAELICELEPERRFYPKQDQWINEVSIKRQALGDIYIYYANRTADERVILTAYLNPMMMLIWAGWLIMIFGGAFAIIPFSGNRVGLSE